MKRPNKKRTGSGVSELISWPRTSKEMDAIKASIKLYVESNGKKRKCPFCGEYFQDFRVIGMQCSACYKILDKEMVSEIMLLLAQDEIKAAGATILSSEYQAILRKYRIV